MARATGPPGRVTGTISIERAGKRYIAPYSMDKNGWVRVVSEYGSKRARVYVDPEGAAHLLLSELVATYQRKLEK